jgi:S-adenosylmethionine hydrolase
MNDQPIITLLTDFGVADNYVGVVKGVIASINSRAKIIDISHNLPAFNIEAGRYLLETSYKAFPPETIHLAIVDPGVGTSRHAIVVDCGLCRFVGPDNGLFGFLPKKEIKCVYTINNKKYFFRDVSSTFHGRDIFAPVAAYLSLGVIPSEFGTPLAKMVRPETKPYRKTKKGIVGKIMYIDHFGNLATSIKAEKIPFKQATVYFNDRKIGKIKKTFGSSRAGKPVCFVNSVGFLEIAINKGSAADYFEADYSSNYEILIAPE